MHRPRWRLDLAAIVLLLAGCTVTAGRASSTSTGTPVQVAGDNCAWVEGGVTRTGLLGGSAAPKTAVCVRVTAPPQEMPDRTMLAVEIWALSERTAHLELRPRAATIDGYLVADKSFADAPLACAAGALDGLSSISWSVPKGRAVYCAAAQKIAKADHGQYEVTLRAGTVDLHVTAEPPPA